MELTKIQLNQIDFPLFFSDSGDFIIEQEAETINIGLSGLVSGDFEVTGSLYVNGEEITPEDDLNILNSYLFEDVTTGSENISGNILFGTKNSTINDSTKNNIFVNTDSVSLQENRKNNTIIGVQNFYGLNVEDSVLLFGKEFRVLPSRIKSNSIIIDFDKGNTFQGISVFNNSLKSDSIYSENFDFNEIKASNFNLSGNLVCDQFESIGAFVFDGGAWVNDEITISGSAKLINNSTNSELATESWVESRGYVSSGVYSSLETGDILLSSDLKVEKEDEESSSTVGKIIFESGTVYFPQSIISQDETKKTYVSGLLSGDCNIYINGESFIYPEKEKIASEDWFQESSFLTGEASISGKDFNINSSANVLGDITFNEFEVSGFYQKTGSGSGEVYLNDYLIKTESGIFTENITISGDLNVSGDTNIRDIGSIELNSNLNINELRVRRLSDINIYNTAKINGFDIATSSWFYNDYSAETTNEKTLTNLTSTGQVNVFGNTKISTLDIQNYSEIPTGSYTEPNVFGGDISIDKAVSNTNVQVASADSQFPEIALSGYETGTFVEFEKVSVKNLDGDILNFSNNLDSSYLNLSSSRITLPNPEGADFYSSSGVRIEEIPVKGLNVLPLAKATKVNKISGTKKDNDYDNSYLSVQDLDDKLLAYAFSSPFTNIISRDKNINYWLHFLSMENPYLNWTNFNRGMPSGKNVNLFWRLFGYWVDWINSSGPKPIIKPYVEDYLKLICRSSDSLRADGKESGAKAIFENLFYQDEKRADESNITEWDQTKLSDYAGLLYSDYQKENYKRLDEISKQWSSFDNLTHDFFGWSDILVLQSAGGDDIFYMSFPSAWVPQTEEDVKINSSRENLFVSYFEEGMSIDAFADYKQDDFCIRPYFRFFDINDNLNPNKNVVTINTDAFSDFYTLDSILEKTAHMFMNTFPTVLDGNDNWQDNIADSYKYDGGGWNNGPIHNRVFPDSDLIPENLETMNQLP